MSKPLSSFRDNELQRAVARRINSATGGLGYLSAMDYQAGKATRVKAAKAKTAQKAVEAEDANNFVDDYVEGMVTAMAEIVVAEMEAIGLVVNAE